MAYQKVRLVVDMLIDTDAWENTYGVDPLDGDPDDVAVYVAGQIISSAAWSERCIISTSVR